MYAFMVILRQSVIFLVKNEQISEQMHTNLLKTVSLHYNDSQHNN